LLGASGSGRRSIVEALAAAVEKLNGAPINKWFIDATDDSQNPAKGTIGEYGPVGMTPETLYGFKREDGTWEDGVFSAALR